MKEIRMDYDTYEDELGHKYDRGYLMALIAILELMGKISNNVAIIDKWETLESEVKTLQDIWRKSLNGNA